MPVTSPREYNAPLVVALDLGTSSVRAIIFDGLGRSVTEMAAQIPYKMNVTPDGGVEIDADELIEIALRAVDEMLARAAAVGLESKIEAVAVSALWHSLVGVDGEARAITPLYNWNDTRATAAARELREQLDERELHARTGCVLHASYWPAKLTWLRRSAPDIFNRVRRWMSIGEYLYLRLFGKTVCSVSMASATGLFNQNECRWDGAILSHLKLDVEHLSPLGDTDSSFVGLDVEHARRWPALAQARWFPALGDGACANVGSGCVKRDRAALMVGTSGALRVLWQADAVKIPQGLWCYRADRRRFVMGGALSNGGDLFEWMWRTLRLGSIEEVEACLEAMEPDAHGLTALPFLSGERSTGWAGDARAAITGLSLDSSATEIIRASIESVAYRLAAIYDIVVEEIAAPNKIIASGAAMLRSRAWAQIISDVIGKKIIISAEPETSSRGAALLALESLGAISDIEDLEAAPGRVHSPNAERYALYARARERQRRLYQALIETHWSS